MYCIEPYKNFKNDNKCFFFFLQYLSKKEKIKIHQLKQVK